MGLVCMRVVSKSGDGGMFASCLMNYFRVELILSLVSRFMFLRHDTLKFIGYWILTWTPRCSLRMRYLSIDVSGNFRLLRERTGLTSCGHWQFPESVVFVTTKIKSRQSEVRYIMSCELFSAPSSAHHCLPGLFDKPSSPRLRLTSLVPTEALIARRT
jgi:hypothetical protein